MDNVNKTLYIPLYGKAYVSSKGIILDDKKAEEIWEKEQFALKGKAKSKWLAYYMGMRSAVFDSWLRDRMAADQDAVIIHIGCGMDSRVLRVGTNNHKWYDVDFPQVIDERCRYYGETADYKMLAGDARDVAWLDCIAETGSAIIVMEGISMYLTTTEIRTLLEALGRRFEKLAVLMDCYTCLAAKMSAKANPVNTVGVTQVYGLDNPQELAGGRIAFVGEHDITPQKYIDQLKLAERLIFSKLYAGSFSEKLYKMFEYSMC